MLSFDVENHKFNYRTAEIVIHNNLILFGIDWKVVLLQNVSIRKSIFYC